MALTLKLAYCPRPVRPVGQQDPVCQTCIIMRRAAYGGCLNMLYLTKHRLNHVEKLVPENPNRLKWDLVEWLGNRNVADDVDGVVGLLERSGEEIWRIFQNEIVLQLRESVCAQGCECNGEGLCGAYKKIGIFLARGTKPICGITPQGIREIVNLI